MTGKPIITILISNCRNRHEPPLKFTLNLLTGFPSVSPQRNHMKNSSGSWLLKKIVMLDRHLTARHIIAPVIHADQNEREPNPVQSPIRNGDLLVPTRQRQRGPIARHTTTCACDGYAINKHLNARCCWHQSIGRSEIRALAIDLQH